MFWHTPGEPGLHGITISRFNGEFHLFTTQGSIESRNIRHAVSSDLVRWRRQPDILGRGPHDAFDAFTLYDLQVIEHAGAYYLFYTGLDRPTGPRQRQAIGLAISRDLVRWERHPWNPVLQAPAEYYEPFVPDVATYQEKDRGRQWFRDPWVHRDPLSGKWGMAVGARATGVHPDVAGCFAWAESDDLVHWTPRPPLYCPQRFHTMECPVIFEMGGRTYLIWLTHPAWGTPLITTDPWQRAGGFYAVSDHGLAGPWRRPADEMLIGGGFGSPDFVGVRMRTMVFRTIVGMGESNFVSYHLNTTPDARDRLDGSAHAAFAAARTVMPLPKPVAAQPDGELVVGYNPAMDGFLLPQARPDGEPAANWRRGEGTWSGKDFGKRSVHLLNGNLSDGVFGALVRVTRGLRAGLVLRAASAKGPGLAVMLDYNLGCLEFAALDDPQPLDRRKWQPRGGWVDLRVVAHGPSLEIYVDGKLMLHQVRYREAGGRVGLIVDQAEAQFGALDLRPLKPGTPLLMAD